MSQRSKISNTHYSIILPICESEIKIAYMQSNFSKQVDSILASYVNTLTNMVNPENNLYFYHSDHLGSSSFITDADGITTQHLQYLPYGELFVEQRSTANYFTPYKFSAKEKDEETSYSYFGARYLASDFSFWLSVDPLADKYPNISPFAYCAWNPIRLIDPDGRDWYESETGSIIWQKGDAKSVEIKGDAYKNIGTTYSAKMSDGSYTNYFQNYAISVGNKENALGTIVNTPQLESAFLQSKGVSDQDKSTIFNANIYQGQKNFLKGSAEFTGYALSNIGTGVQVVGYGVTLFGGGAVGAPLMAIGSSLSGIGDGITAGVNLIDGDYSDAAINIGSAGMSGLGHLGVSKINGLSKSNKLILDGGIDLKVGLASWITSKALEKNKK